MDCDSPCTGLCQLDHADCCLGCMRTRGEIAAWSEMAVPEKYFVLTAVRERRELSPTIIRYELTAAA